jgi:uncharacterized protein (DUF362 family)
VNRISRRELVAMLGTGALAAWTGSAAGSRWRLPGVVGVAGASAELGQRLSDEAAAAAMAGALVAATGAASAVEAVRSLFDPDDVVGIKVNCLSGRLLSPRRELVEALVELLARAQLERQRIVVFERTSRELERAGFEPGDKGGRYRCVGIDNDYDREPTESGSIGSCFAKLVSRDCTALVSFGVVKDHDLAGVSAGLKNWYGVIHNPNKYHQNGCSPFVADVVRHPFIRDKLRLTVLDGVVAQYHGGPAYRPGATFPLGKVAASTDPVAIDLWAWEAIDAARSAHGLASLEEAGRPPRFLAAAAGYGLGTADPADVKVVTA